MRRSYPPWYLCEMGFRRSTAYKVLPGVRLTIRDPETGRHRPLALRPVPPAHAGPAAARPVDRRLHRALLLGDVEGVRRAAARRGHGLLGTALAGLTAYAIGAGEAHALLRASWDAGGAGGTVSFADDHAAHATVRIDLTVGVQAYLPPSWDSVGLALAALERRRGLDAAIAVVEELDPSVVATLVLADLYLEADRPWDVVELTEGMTNTDDPTALLLVMRALALRLAGRPGAADSVLHEAIRWGVRGSVVRRIAVLAMNAGPRPDE